MNTLSSIFTHLTMCQFCRIPYFSPKVGNLKEGKRHKTHCFFLFLHYFFLSIFSSVSFFSSLLICILFSFVLCCWEDWENFCVYVHFVNELPDPSAPLSNTGSQLRGHKSNFKDEIKINWNAHQLRTLAGIYLQTDAETLDIQF